MIGLILAFLAAPGSSPPLPKTYAAADVWYQCGIGQMDRLDPAGTSAETPAALASEAMSACATQEHDVIATAYTELHDTFNDDTKCRDLSEAMLVQLGIGVHDQLTALATSARAKAGAH